MAWVHLGIIGTITDAIAANLVSGPTATRLAVDARVKVGAADAVADAVADSTVVKDAAVAAMSDAAVQAQLAWRKPNDGYDTSRSADDYWRAADNGAWRLPASYTDGLPSGLPTVAKTLKVVSHGDTGDQTLTMYGSTQIWWREISNFTTTPRTWTVWRRIDVATADVDDLKTRTNGVFYRNQTTLADGTDLNTFTAVSANGMHVIGSTQTYTNLPPRPGTTVGVLFNFTTGTGTVDGWQRVVWRFNGGVYDRYRTGASSWTEWQTPGNGGGAIDPDLEGRIRLIEDTTTLETGFEVTGAISTLGAGEAFATRLARKHEDVVVHDIGVSTQGRTITGITLGDTAKPALFVMCAQHGDEIAGREAVLPWLRDLAATPPAALDDVCIVVVPAVNVDNLTFTRLSATQTDLNRNWTTRTTAEVSAVASWLDSFNVVAVLDAHEGGNWTDAQIAGPTSPDVAPAVATLAASLYSAVEDALVAASIPTSLYPGVDTNEVARNSIAVTEGLPILVVETPSQLGGTGWEGPEPNPALYSPPLATRVTMYRTILDAALAWAAAQSA